jgi:hypothetical protein
MDVNGILKEMTEAAKTASDDYLKEHLGGVDRYACGFAWTNIVPKHKGNTRDGKAERAVYTALGFEKDWTGKEFQLWNPGKWGGQNIDVKEAGALAAAAVLRKHGIDAYAESRMD